MPSAHPRRCWRAGQAAGDPIAVLPVLFHLLWCQELSADLSTPLHQDTVVTLAGAGR